MVRVSLVSRRLLFAVCLGLLFTPPAEASDEAGVDPALIILPPSAVGLTLNVLSGVAELTRTGDGYMKPGWIAVQYVTGGLNVAAGGFVAASLADEGGEFSAIPFGLGGLWLGLATYHVVHNHKVGRPVERPNYVPHAGVTRDGGFTAGLSVRW